MIMGIIRPDLGGIRFATNGQPGPLNKQRIGYLPEERGLYDDTRVLDTLVYFGELKGLLRVDARRCAREWLARMDLLDWADKKIEKLSKGMQQKVQFLAAILHQPDLIVLDEPFAGLDPVHQDLFKEIIRDLRDEGMTILLSSHQMNRVEELCDRIFLIHRGRKVLYGNLGQIKEAHGTHAVRLRFTGDAGYLRNDARIEDLKIDGDVVTFTLSKGVDPDAFVRSIPKSIAIREIAIERPPLHDIFVETVSGGDRESA
jgi:ABC-2 type transport system ATP-binding protein